MTRRQPPPSPRRCAHEPCGIEFQPKKSVQIYCLPIHANAAANARRTEKHEYRSICKVCEQVLVSNRPDVKYHPECRRAARQIKKDENFEEPVNFERLEIDSLPDGTRIVIVNDHQIPFQDKPVVAAVSRFMTDWQPHIEVYNGDIADCYLISSFSRNPSRRKNLQQEFDETRLYLDERVTANPSAHRFFLDGNHEERMDRFLKKEAPALHSLRDLDLDRQFRLTEMGFRRLSYKSKLSILGFVIEHGDKASNSKAYPVNVARLKAVETGSSGLCGHTHHCSSYSWTDERGDHTYYENGCLCRFDLEYAAFPNWQHGFSYGEVRKNILHITQVRILDDGFKAAGEDYKLKGRTIPRSEKIKLEVTI